MTLSNFVNQCDAIVQTSVPREILLSATKTQRDMFTAQWVQPDTLASIKPSTASKHLCELLKAESEYHAERPQNGAVRELEINHRRRLKFILGHSYHAQACLEGRKSR